MAAGTRMRRRMTCRRAVAAQCGAARLAGSQMHPAAAHLHAFLALAALRLFDVLDRRQVCTGFLLRHLRLLQARDYSASTRCTNEIAIDPSPTADATRLMFPARTSPTA